MAKQAAEATKEALAKLPLPQKQLWPDLSWEEVSAYWHKTIRHCLREDSDHQPHMRAPKLLLYASGESSQGSQDEGGIIIDVDPTFSKIRWCLA